ncbi:MAG: phenylalanyl-tRNA synthetase alpha chain [Candidatus Tokpelaia sp. JSC161]|nr:MAG: phenylalanyl-tRNA synthetase alpha chain [Candidatus Tokpelaia sp. JSC161]
MHNIKIIEKKILQAIEETENIETLETIRISTLGKKGFISEKLKKIGTLPLTERQAHGTILNHLKSQINKLLHKKHQEIKKKTIHQRIQEESIDITLPVRNNPIDDGRIHPISQVIHEITSIFLKKGFTLAEGPEIETDYYNFIALNFPKEHPARDMHDTFFFHPNEKGETKLLRTHTSPVQIRTMENQKPPIRIIIPGKTYRIDSDKTHSPMFHQMEGLVIDKTSTIAHMIGLLEEFCQSFFETPSIKMRFRPSFFPFTEPSMELDIQYHHSKKETKWMEILGCGMIHPQVLRNCGLNPEEYQGFAWGMGIDRITMLKYDIQDLRDFFETDIRWLKHYGFPLFS